ncbi:MAG: DUF2914 domain-containing protein [Patescibacteria group bacterium]
MFSRAKSFWERNERRLSLVAFVGGFLWDNLTLTRVDRLFDNLVLAAYLIVVFAALCLLNAHGAGHLQGALSKRGVNFAKVALPFAFGGLFSGFLIFYSRSGEVLASLPFLLVLCAFFLGNELFKKHYERLTFQMSFFFVALFSYSALILPVLLGGMGDGIFILSGCLALILFWLSLRALRLVAREEVEKSKRVLLPIVGILFVTFNVLYFNNMIPPIPLSLKEIGIYHTVERTLASEYRLSFEKAPWYAFGKKTGAIFHRVGDEPVYAWSSVFAPTRLNTDILHRWSYFSESSGEWIDSSIIGFPIYGGRSEGYRGYSRKEKIFPGKWRVDVETLRGQILGRFVFTVEDSAAPPVLSSEIR